MTTSAEHEARLEQFRRITSGSCGHRWPKGGCESCAHATWIGMHGGKPPMEDAAAEIAIVVSCMVDVDAIARVHETGIQPDDFTQWRCRWVYEAIRAIAEREGDGMRQVHAVDALTGAAVTYWERDPGVNVVTVAAELRQRPADDLQHSRLEAVTLAWLSKVTGALVTSVGAAWYARLVMDCAERRRALAAAEAVLSAAELGTPDVAAKAVAVFEGIGGGATPAGAQPPAPTTRTARPSGRALVLDALEMLA